MSDEPLLIPPKDAAKLLSLSPRTLWTMTKAGEVPSLKIGKLVRYSPDQLREWIDRQAAPPIGFATL